MKLSVDLAVKNKYFIVKSVPLGGKNFPSTRANPPDPTKPSPPASHIVRAHSFGSTGNKRGQIAQAPSTARAAQPVCGAICTGKFPFFLLYVAVCSFFFPSPNQYVCVDTHSPFHTPLPIRSNG